MSIQIHHRAPRNARLYRQSASRDQRISDHGRCSDLQWRLRGFLCGRPESSLGITLNTTTGTISGTPTTVTPITAIPLPQRTPEARSASSSIFKSTTSPLLPRVRHEPSRRHERSRHRERYADIRRWRGCLVRRESDASGGPRFQHEHWCHFRHADRHHHESQLHRHRDE